MEGWAMVDGVLAPLREATVPVTDMGFTHGWSVFETIEAGTDGEDLRPHLQRLRASCEEALITMPDEETLVGEIRQVVGRVGPSWVRVTLTGSGTRVVQAVPVDTRRWHKPHRCVTGPHCNMPFLAGSVKHGSRAGWIVEVRRSGADEVLFVDEEGRFTEGSSCAILAVVDGAVHTAPWDGRILESTTLRRMLDACERLGVPVVRRGARVEGPFDALYIASTTRSIAPVIELDGRALPAWDPVGERLRDAEDRSRP